MRDKNKGSKHPPLKTPDDQGIKMKPKPSRGGIRNKTKGQNNPLEKHPMIKRSK
jgi:hypothetical protein